MRAQEDDEPWMVAVATRDGGPRGARKAAFRGVAKAQARQRHPALCV